MSKPVVSAVITTYKRSGQMLLQAVESVRNQTYRPLEIIVVSDNPPDSNEAREVAEALTELPDVKLIQLKRNSGAQIARNTGIRTSSGEFVAFLDDDDLWMPEKIAQQIPAFSDPKVGLVYCRGYDFFDNTEDLRDYYTTTLGFRTSLSFEELLESDLIGSTSQAVIRRVCFDDCGYFDEAFKARQDYDRWLSITQKYKAVGIDAPLFLHREHKAERITRSHEVALEAYKQLYRKYRVHLRKYPSFCMKYHFRTAVLMRVLSRNAGSLYYYARSFLCSPVAFIHRFRSQKLRDAERKSRVSA